jgi:osmoprotectant transport system permease protein
MGMTGRERLLRIELPLAWPIILTGIRVAAVLLIGIAAIAAAVNGPGLGSDIFDGLARVGSPVAINLVLGGTLGVIVLALIFDGLFLGLQKLTTSRGIRD